MIVGPLPFDETRARFDAVERAPYRADLQLEGLKGSVGWRLHEGSDDRVHLERFLDCRERAMTYLIAWIYASPAPQRAQLSIGSDDGCVLWINREQKFEFRGPRSSSPAQDRVAIDLRGGWNEILVLVDNSGGSDWGWYCEVRTADGSQPLPVVLSASPPTPRPRPDAPTPRPGDTVSLQNGRALAARTVPHPPEAAAAERRHRPGAARESTLLQHELRERQPTVG